MPTHKEVTVFTKGNAQSAKTWSNIPYFLVAILRDKGYMVNLVNVESSSIWEKVYDKLFCRLLRKLFLRGTSFSYERSLRYTKEVHSIMEKAVAQYPDSDWYLSTSFSYSPINLTPKPCILFCDWTYDYYLKHFRNRKPDIFEKKEVIRQNKIIEQADMVFSLFPDVTEYMRSQYQNPHIYYLGNVINSDLIEYDKAILGDRKKQPHVLFIGLPKYLEGALSLIEAIKFLHQNGLDLKLDIIGMNEKDIPDKLPAYVHCHGYLDKSNLQEKTQYDALLANALVYVNTTPVWAGFSSALEAMYHYIPVITTPYQSFTDTFGNSIDFGYYCAENTAKSIADFLTKIYNMETDSYLKICQNARNAADPFTWSSYVDKMLNKISSITIQ